MSKIDALTPVTNLSTGSAVTIINLNNDKIVEALQNTLSRDGSAPNHMDADLDMNDNDILNIHTLQVDTLAVNDISLNDGDLDGFLAQCEDARDDAQDAATAAQASASSASTSASTATTQAGIATTQAGLASASAAAAAASAAALPAITANTLLVDNSAGTLRQSKTFAQVNDLLEKATWAFDNNTLYKSRSNKDRWQDSYRLNEELNYTGGGSAATDAAILQGLINRAVAGGRGEIILPRGDTKLEAVVQARNPSATNFIRIVGQGPDSTRLLNNSAAQHWLDIGDASIARTSGFIFEGFSTTPGVAMNDSGSVFYLRNTTDIAFKDIVVRSCRNGWSLGIGASATNDVVYTTMNNCGGTSSGTSGVAMINLGSGGILNITGGASRWNANGGHHFIDHLNTSWNFDGFYLSGQFFEFWQKYLLSTGKGMVNVEWTGCQVDRADIFFHAEPSIAAGSNRNWNIHDVQVLGFPAGGGIGCLLSKGSSTDTQGIEDMAVNNCVFNGLSDIAIWAPHGEIFAKDNRIVSCAQLGGAAPAGGGLIRVGQGMCQINDNIGRRALNSPGIAYVTGIQWDGAALATRKAAGNDFFSFSGAAETGTK
jgi:hypothetical protein